MPDHPLARLGWRASLQGHLEALGDDDLVAGRVTAVDRGRAIVDTGTDAWSAPLAGRLRRTSAMPATGDFVAALPRGPLRAVLPRGGDLALLVTSMNRDLNPRRLARFLQITSSGDVEAAVLLTKSDLEPDRALIAEDVEDALGGAAVLTVSARDGNGMAAVRGLLGPGITAVLLGSSGVGKS